MLELLFSVVLFATAKEQTLDSCLEAGFGNNRQLVTLRSSESSLYAQCSAFNNSTYSMTQEKSDGNVNALRASIKITADYTITQPLCWCRFASSIWKMP